MKIIELGRCTDNQDPLGLGRIRVEFLEKMNSSLERSVTSYEKWDALDPFLFYPFLPAHINIIPQENQLTKLLLWDTNNSSLNREYIAGSFVNVFDFYNQGVDRQLQSTSRGVRIKKEPNIFDPKTHKLLDANTKGVIADTKDVALYGHYGSDLILTKNGFSLRAGKLDDAQVKKSGKPISDQRPARVGFKKFDAAITLETSDITVTEPQHKELSSIVEYEVDIIDSGSLFNGRIKLYKIKTPIAGLTSTENFDQNKIIDDTNKSLVYVKEFSGLTLTQIGRDISQQLRLIDSTIIHTELNSEFIGSLIHPFYYKPSAGFASSFSLNPANAKMVLDGVNLGSTKGYGLSYSTKEKQVPVKQVVQKQINEVHKNESVSIGHLLSDMLFLLSYQANSADDVSKIDFAKIDNYEPSQEQMLNEILPKTSSAVRGEPLLNLLGLMIQWMINHIHNPAEAGIAPQGLKEELLKAFQNANESILNQKIRIN